MSYIRFKHKLRQRLPEKIRYATVCRKCKTPVVTKRCDTCKIEQAVWWSKPY